MTSFENCDLNYNRRKINIKNSLLLFLSFLKKKAVWVGIPVFLLVVGILYVGLIRFGVIKDPFPLPNIPLLQTGPQVSIKKEYKNPFDKKTQYVNPFETYKNPFVVAK
ncbi:hypothetical protein HYS92_00105 [Candidatus Daviesbacteria bacterium]|nr:hypothetical protein [Candidatus Daviesbacteria bacterium]